MKLINQDDEFKGLTSRPGGFNQAKCG